jgi:putative tricarboxylic transport membrane protein
VYSIEGSLFHVGVALFFGVVGYLLRLWDAPLLPMVLGVVLGFMVESNYRRTLALSGGDHAAFLRDPISAVLLSAALVFVVTSLVRHARDRRGRAPEAARG